MATETRARLRGNHSEMNDDMIIMGRSSRLRFSSAAGSAIRSKGEESTMPPTGPSIISLLIPKFNWGRLLALAAFIFALSAHGR
jgi:hypothetical protein